MEQGIPIAGHLFELWAVQNPDSEYSHELFINLKRGCDGLCESIAIVRPVHDDGKPSPDYFEIMIAKDGGDDFHHAVFELQNGECADKVPLRMRGEKGMMPYTSGFSDKKGGYAMVGNGIDIRVGDSDYVLSVRMMSDAGEMYIGVSYGVDYHYWWQNLCRIRTKYNKEIEQLVLRVEPFSEFHRGYVCQKTFFFFL